MSNAPRRLKLQPLPRADLIRQAYSAGEYSFEKETNTIRVYDGVTKGGHRLATEQFVQDNQNLQDIDSDITPGLGNTYNLGSPEKPWKSLYVSTNTIYIGGTALGVVDGQLTVGDGGAPVNLATEDYVNNRGFITSAALYWNNITNKPAFSAVATSGSYNDLSNKPTLFSGSYNDLTNKPVLFSGSYTDLTNKPSIPTKTSELTNDAGFITAAGQTAQVQVDWNQTSTSAVDYIKNKPVLFSGNYNDLTNKPTIPSLTGYATETYVNTAVSNLVDSSPETLNTLNELAAALGDDPNFASSIAGQIGTKAPLSNPTFTGGITVISDGTIEAYSAANFFGPDISSGELFNIGTGSEGVYWKPDGTKFWKIDGNSRYIQEWTLSTPWMLSSATAGAYKDYSSFANPSFYSVRNHLHFSSDGTKILVLVVVGMQGPFLAQFVLSTPWDISSMSTFNYNTTKLNGINTYNNSFTFKPDGTRLFVTSGGYIAAYDLSTAWNINTVNVSTSQFAQYNQYLYNGEYPMGITFNNNGTKVYVNGVARIYSFSLNAAYNIETMVAASKTQFDVEPVSFIDYNGSGSLQWNPDGTSLFYVGIDLSDNSTYIGKFDVAPAVPRAVINGNLVISGTATGITAAMVGAEPTISTGTNNQFWRGDKSWQSITAADVGLGNVTNESKATMFTDPTFTGTVTSGRITATAASLLDVVGATATPISLISDTSAGKQGLFVTHYRETAGTDSAGTYTQITRNIGTADYTSNTNSFIRLRNSTSALNSAFKFPISFGDGTSGETVAVDYFGRLHIGVPISGTVPSNTLNITNSSPNIGFIDGLALNATAKYSRIDANDGNLAFAADILGQQASTTISFIVDGSSVDNASVKILTKDTASSSTSTGALVVAGGIGASAKSTLSAVDVLNEFTVAGVATFRRTTEELVLFSGASGVVIHDYQNGAIYWHSSIAGNFTPNFTQVPTTNNRSIVLTLVLLQGSTGYIPNAVQIDGVSQTIKWYAGASPTGTANKVEVVTFTLLRANNTWTVLGSMSSYGT